MHKLNSTIVIAFMGVDGSGKSTLIKQLNKRLKNNYKKIKNLHLRPYFFLTDTSTTNSNPHNQKKLRSKFTSLVIILKWLFIYHIFFLINLRITRQLIIFDRYAHDILIDKIRYRLNLPQRYKKFILSLFPKPHLWLILKAPIKIIEKRKKELPTRELKRQMSKYINFSKKNKNMLIVNTELNIQKNISLIIKKMKFIVK